MTTHRMLPPADGNHGTITVNGRTYTCALGSSIDVPDFDGVIMQANGWTISAAGGAGATAARPVLVSNQRGYQFHDSTLGKNIVWDGKTWRDPTNGNSV